MDDWLNLVASTLSCERAVLTDDASPDTIKTWDSVTHILLLSILEEHYGVEFSDRDAVNIRCIGDVRRMLKEKKAIA